MLLNKNKGFTLAELMVVFTVIGIVAAILTPVLFSISPNTPELKAKKAYNTFVRAVESLTNGEPYESNDGVLDATPFISGSDTNDNVKAQRNNFFCNNLANLLNVSDSNCNIAADRSQMWIPGVVPNYAEGNEDANYPNAPQNLYFDNTSNVNTYRYDFLQESLDRICEGHVGDPGHVGNAAYNFFTSDGVGWVVQKYSFRHETTLTDAAGNVIPNLYPTHTYNGVTTATIYAAVCVNTGKDVTGSNDVTNVYAMGVNRDGKVLAGAKLQRLIDENFTEAAN